jgi:cation-transporting ATPase 13A1
MGCSIFGQFAIHLVILIYIVQQAQTLSGGVKPKPDADFAPSLVNSAVFLIMTTMQLATFAINYEGYPFMEGLSANKPLHRLLLIMGGVILLATTQLLPEFNDKFQLAPLPSPFSQLLLGAMIVDVLSSWLWERVCKWLLY